MPYVTLCSWPGCPNTIDVGNYCEEHRPQRTSPKKTDPKYWTTSWRQTQKYVFVRDHYHCQACDRLLSDGQAHCDHIIPVAQGGSDYEDNLQTLCIACHNRKTRAEEAGR